MLVTFVFLLLWALVPQRTVAIFDWTPANSGQFPFHAQIQVFHQDELDLVREWRCGGSIISTNLVLASAHYVWNFTDTETGATTSPVKVIAGEFRWAQQGFTSQTRMVKRVVIHEDFDGGSLGVNDLAVLVLAYPLQFNDFVFKAVVPAQDQQYDPDGQLSGFGETEGQFSDVLLQTYLRVMNNSECKQTIDSLTKLATGDDAPTEEEEAESGSGQIETWTPFLDAEDDSFICGVGYDGGNMCGVDSGSPLLCYTEGKPYICGIVSWTTLKECGRPIPAIFTAVANYSCWIKDKIAEFNYTCDLNTQFNCGDGTCIPLSQQCDNKVDCSMGTDEMNCAPCGANQMRCSSRDNVTSKQCVDASYICDGAPDCGGSASDELGCDGCDVNQFKCPDGSCIDKVFICDGVKQCTDARDEFGCGNCARTEFQCKNGKCVTADQVCDGLNSCTDGSDEVGCGYCSSSEFQCSDGNCIDMGSVCDSKFDCPDGSDEYKCTRCGLFMFECGNGACIDEQLRCDSKPDCADGSDELNCTCKAWHFECTSGACVDSTFRCDNRNDCPDGSDELNCTSTRCSAQMYRCDSNYCIRAFLNCEYREECFVRMDKNYQPLRASCQSEWIPMLNANNMVLTVPPGSDTPVFTCETHFQLPALLRPKLSWSFNGRELPPDGIRVGRAPGGTKLFLQVNNVTLLDQGYYKCTATNAIGQDEVSVLLRVEEDEHHCERCLEIGSCLKRGCAFIESTRECVQMDSVWPKVGIGSFSEPKPKHKDRRVNEYLERQMHGEPEPVQSVADEVMDYGIKIFACIGALCTVVAVLLLLDRSIKRCHKMPESPLNTEGGIPEQQVAEPEAEPLTISVAVEQAPGDSETDT